MNSRMSAFTTARGVIDMVTAVGGGDPDSPSVVIEQGDFDDAMRCIADLAAANSAAERKAMVAIAAALATLRAETK